MISQPDTFEQGFAGWGFEYYRSTINPTGNEERITSRHWYAPVEGFSSVASFLLDRIHFNRAWRADFRKDTQQGLPRATAISATQIERVAIEDYDHCIHGFDFHLVSVRSLRPDVVVQLRGSNAHPVDPNESELSMQKRRDSKTGFVTLSIMDSGVVPEWVGTLPEAT